MTVCPDQLQQGVQQFQQSEFYACHDTLEALWIEAQEPDKTFLQGILQVAVGCYHLTQQNWRGAVILLGEGIRRLSDYQPEYGGIDVAHFVNTSYDYLEWLQGEGAERVAYCSAQFQLQLQDQPPTSALGRSPEIPTIPTLRYC